MRKYYTLAGFIVVFLTMMSGIYLTFSKRINWKTYFVGFTAQWPMSQIDTLKVMLLGLIQWSLEIFALAVVLSFLILGSVESVAVMSTFLSNFSTLLPSAPG